MGFPRVVVECLLALAQHTRGRTAIEIVNLHEVGKAVASEPPRALQYIDMRLWVFLIV